MIDIETFESNFMSHHKDELARKNIDVVRLYAKVSGKYRAVEFLTKPIDMNRVAFSHLKSKAIAEKYNLSFSIENFGRGEGETILRRSFSTKVDEYNTEHEEELIGVMNTLAKAEQEFYSQVSR